MTNFIKRRTGQASISEDKDWYTHDKDSDVITFAAEILVGMMMIPLMGVQ